MACLNYKLRVSTNYSESNPNGYQNMGGARGGKHGLADFHFRALSSQLSSIVLNSYLRKMAYNQRIRAPTRIYVVIIVGFRSRPTTHHCLVPIQLVNCPTQPTCIAHCDLCICQLSRRWQPSLALSKMFEPFLRP